MRPQAQTSLLSQSFISLGLIGSFLIAGIVIAIVLSTGNLNTGLQVLLIPFIVTAVVLIFANPYYGIIIYLHYSFIFVAITRYVSGPLGLFVDIILFLTVLSTLAKIEWKSLRQLNTGIFYLIISWFLYTVLQLLNPESTNPTAWFYAIRGISLYAATAVPLALLLYNKPKDLDHFIKLILGWSVFASLWGMKQITIGLDFGEQRWFDTIGNVTHFIDGRLRAFSLFSDAGQNGTTMAYASFIALVMALGPYERKRKIRYLVIGLICFVGFTISASRGPLFVVVTGFILYLFLIKRFKILSIGLVIGAFAFAFLKFTFIGNSNYQIFRLRTALDPNDASLLVRLGNQKTLRQYLESRPFGNGIGSSYYWANKYYPGSFLSKIPVDSWFVNIWVENGVIGLALHFLAITYVIIMGFHNTYKTRNPDLKQKLMAIYGGFVGVVVASFGNPVFGQAPLGALMYLSMVFLSIAPLMDSNKNTLAVNELLV